MKTISDMLHAAGFGFAMLALIGLLLGTWAGRKPYHEMRTWPATDAEVVQSAITSLVKRSDWPLFGGTSYGATFIFRYSVDGQQYFAQKDMGYQSGSEKEMTKWVQRIPRGSRRTIHYDPQNPLRVSLATGFDSLSFAPTLAVWRWALIFGVIGIALYVGGNIWRKRKNIARE